MAHVDNLLEARDTHAAAPEADAEHEHAADATHSSEGSRLRWQKEAFQAALKGAPLAESLSVLARMVTDGSNGDVRTAFYTADADGTTLHPIWGAGTMPEEYLKQINGFAIGPDSLACGLAVPTGQPVVTRDVHTEPRCKPWTDIADQFGYRGCWSFPMKTNEETPIGTFAVYYREPREATSYDLALADAVTQAAAIIISRDREAQERARAESASRASEQRMRKAISIETVGVLFFNLDGRITNANDAFVRMSGFTREQLLAITDWNILTPEEYAEPTRKTAEALATRGEAPTYEKEMKRPDGTRWWALCAPTRLSGEGKTAECVEFIIDVTEARRAEQALRTSDERFRRVLETEAVGVIFFDNEGVLVDANDAFLRSTGYTREEVSRRQLHWRKLTPPDWLPVSEREMQKLAITGRIGPYEKQYLRKDGSRVWMLFAGRDLGDGTLVEFAIDVTDRKEAEEKLRQREEQLQGANISLTQRLRQLEAAEKDLRESRLATLNVLEDAVAARDALEIEVRERKQAAQALRESEARFRLMANVIPQIIWITDGEGQLQFVNEHWTEYTGCEFTPQSAKEIIRELAHPDDIARITERFQGALATGTTYIDEHRIRSANGEYRWFLVRGEPYRDPVTGKITHWFGATIDIHDRKQTESALRESEERMRMLADAVPQLIWTNSADGTANYFNRRWYQYTGLDYDQSAGLGWQAVVHPDDLLVSTERWLHALNKGETFDAEYRLRSGGGEYRWFIGRNVPLRDESGRIISWFGTATDIHDLREAIAALRVSEERYRLMVDGARDYAIFMVNPSNEIVYWSAGAERVFGWSAQEAVGQSGEIVFTPEDRANEQEEKEIAVALEKGAASDRRWHIRKDGTRIWVDGVMRRLDDDDTGGLRGFAKIARDATEQRRAEQELRRAHAELEQRVRQRTAELQAMNDTLHQEMMQRQSLERQILEVTERERARISQDLHDSLCQELTATAFFLKSQARSLRQEHGDAARALLDAAETVNTNAGRARDLARGLHPFELGSAGLVSALRELATRTSGTVSCRCECPRSLRVPDENTAVNLYRIAQEAVINAVKHAKATEIVLCIERTSNEIVLSVSDNGKRAVPKKPRHGMGIHMMQYRANVSGGQLTIESKRGHGTKVTCRIPVRR